MLGNLNARNIYSPRYREFVDIKQIRTGQIFSTYRQRVKIILNQIYGGNYQGLFNIEPTDENGLTAISNTANLMRIHYPEIVVGHHTDGVWTDKPYPIHKNYSERQKKMLEEGLEDSVNDELQIATQNRFLHGVGIIAIKRDPVSGVLYPDAIDPETYYEMRQDPTSRRVSGHIIAYPYESQPKRIAATTYTPVLYDRIRITIIDKDKGINEVRDYAYSNSGILQGQITKEESVSEIVDIFTFGRDLMDSMVIRILDLLRQILVAHAHRIRIISNNADPFLQAPGGVFIEDAVEQRKSKDKTLTSGPTSNSMWDYLTIDMNLAAIENQLEEFHSLLMTTSKIPPEMMNWNVGKGQSGTAKSEQKTVSTTIERRVQTEISRILPLIYKELNFGDSKWSFITDPYVSQRTRDEKIGRAIELGTIDNKQASELQGLPENETAEQQQTEVKQSQGNNIMNRVKSMFGRGNN